MRVPTIINKFGKLAGWNDVTVTMLGRDMEGILEVSYDDELDIENVYGAGCFPIGTAEGNYKAKASFTLCHEEVIALQRSLPPGHRLQNIAPFDITFQYEYEGFLYKDRIRNCRIKNNGIALKQGDKTIARKFDIVISHVDWNIQ